MARQPRSGRNSGASQPGRLRIVAGKWRRRLVPVADGEGLRPTAERIRETLFNWLAPVIEGARCLDLCAGTGALGFEALSRGAGSATFVEKSASVSQALKATALMLNATEASVCQADAVRFLELRPPVRYGIVFVDPPYTTDLQGELCRLLAGRGWLTDDALIYLEQDRGKPAPELPDGWYTIRDEIAGKVRYRLLSVRAGSRIKRSDSWA